MTTRTWTDFNAAAVARHALGTRYNAERNRADATGDYTEERRLLAEIERTDAELDAIFRDALAQTPQPPHSETPGLRPDPLGGRRI